MFIQRFPALEAIWIATALLTIEKCKNKPNATKEDLFFEPMDIIKLADQFLDGKVDLYTVNCLATSKQEHSSRNYLQSDSKLQPSFRRLSMIDENDEKCFPKYLKHDKYCNKAFQINGQEFTIEEIFQFVKNELPEYLKREGKVEIDDGFLPKESEYHPGISKEKWVELLKDPQVTDNDNYQKLLQFYKYGCPASISEVSRLSRYSSNALNTLGTGFGKIIYSNTQCPIFDVDKYNVIPFQRKEGKKLIHKLRPELREAIAEVERLKLEKEFLKLAERNFDRNILIYGPSKSEKNLLAIRYAVAICKERSIQEIELIPYQKILEMYKIFVSEKRIEKVMFEDLSQLDFKNDSLLFGDRNDSRTKVLFLENVEKIVNLDTDESLVADIEAISSLYNCKIIGTLDSEKYHSADTNLILTSVFRFIEVKPEVEILRKEGANKVYDLDVADMLARINQRIEYFTDWKMTIGHEHFLELANSSNLRTLQKIFESSVFPLLCLNLKNDYQRIQLILGDNAKKDDLNKFIVDKVDYAKDIFKGDVSQVLEHSKKQYTINRLAFGNLESYREIM